MKSEDINLEELITKLPTRRKDRETNQWKTVYADYLEVKWRMVWYRKDHRENTKTVIKDKIIDRDQRFAYFEIEVTDSNNNTETGVGSETGEDFHDYIEKAYTKAYGRALAALGYGTQFATEISEGERIVDSPVNHSEAATKYKRAEDVFEDRATEAQRKAIYAIYNNLGMDEKDIKEIISKRHNKRDGKSLSKLEASDLIDYLNRLRSNDHYKRMN